MHTGAVKNIVVDRGFGFLAEPGQPDVFFHLRDLVGLEFNEQLVQRRVKFEIVGTEKGPRARQVQAAD